MNSYLLTLVLKPDLEEKAREDLLAGLKKKVFDVDGKVEKTTSAEASVVKEDLWGVRDLAYPIKRQTKGFYAHFQFTSDPKKIKGLDKILKLEEDILRYLLVRV